MLARKLLYVSRESATFAREARLNRTHRTPYAEDAGVYAVKLDNKPSVYVMAADEFDARARVLHTLREDATCVHAERVDPSKILVAL